MKESRLSLKRSDFWMFLAAIAIVGILWLTNQGGSKDPIVVFCILAALASVAILASGKVMVEHIFANGGSEIVWRDTDGNWLLEREDVKGKFPYIFKYLKKQPEGKIEAMNLLLADYCYDAQWPSWAPRMMQVTCRKTIIVDGVVQPVSNRSGYDWLQTPEVIAGVVNSNSLKVSNEATEALTDANAELAELRANKGISQRMSTMIVIWAIMATIAAVMFANQIYQFLPGGAQ